MARRIEPRIINQWKRYFEWRSKGLSPEQAAQRVKLASSTVYRFERGDQSSTGLRVAAMLGVTQVAGLVLDSPLSEEAVEALDDFALFRLRYCGRKSMPWQARAAYEVLRRVESEDREFIVMNEPPGSGKSTLFTCDIPLWLIARNRSIRIQIGSRTERQARMYVSRIKRNLEREIPLRTDADALARGISFDAESAMLIDYGTFQPEGRSDLWRAESLVVRQLDGTGVDDKEPTVSAWGQDSGFLGGRFDLVVWDDLVDRKNTRTAEAKESLREWFDQEAETRVEPGGVFLLQGQRIVHDDLYRFCLDKKTLDETPKYSHVTFAAHHEDLCSEEHGPDAKPWPDGCLLDPHRLPWKFLETIKHTNPRMYETSYQQRDGDLVAGLIDPAWIPGGMDGTGYLAPGCVDRDREVGHVPAHLRDGKGWSFVTVDPSPTEWWGVIWWVYDPDTDRRYAIDLARKRMNPEDFLTMDLDTFVFGGLLETWRVRALRSAAPISHVIVEVNAAQKWLLSQPHVQRYSQVTGLTFLPHSTGINKRDAEFGLESLGEFFRQGKIRLPYQTPTSRLKSHYLIDEGLRHPDSETTDLLMSAWFGLLAIANLYRPPANGMYTEPRPGYMRNVRRGLSSWR